MLSLEALKDMNVMVATPCYASGCSAPYVASVFKLASECAAFGIRLGHELLSESLITRARNRLVAKFLRNPAFTHLFWIDADVEFTPEAFARLLLADRDVVCGVYPLKRYDWPAEGVPAQMTREQFEARYAPYPINPIDGKLTSDTEGFGEVREATTGFMCVKRSVIERMVEAYPELAYVADGYGERIVSNENVDYLFFDTLHEPVSKRYLSEDYAFCHRWRAIGGQIWIDIHSKLNHQGQYNFKGDLYASLKAGGVRQVN